MEEPFTLLEVHADYFYIKLEKLPPYAQIFYGGALQAHFCVFLQKKIAEWKKIAGGKKILAKKILVKKKKIQLRLNLAMSKSFFFAGLRGIWQIGLGFHELLKGLKNNILQV